MTLKCEPCQSVSQGSDGEAHRTTGGDLSNFLKAGLRGRPYGFRNAISQKRNRQIHQEDDPNDFEHKYGPNHHWGPYTLE